MVTNEQRLEALTNVSNAISELYCSLKTAQFIGKVSEKYEITSVDFVHLVGDILLGLVPKHEFTKRLVERLHIPQEKVVAIDSEFKGFFSQVEGVVAIPQPNKDMKERLELRPEGVALGEEKEPKPLTREEVLRALAPTRTMQSDIASLREKKSGAGENSTKDGR